MSDVVITGRVTKDSRPHVLHDGTWQLSVEFSPAAGPKGKPRRYLAVKDYGSGNAAGYACKGVARQLRRGVRVRVYAAGEDESRGRSVLAAVDRIEAPDMPAPGAYLEKADA
jgi:hypothetical protein